MKIWCTLLSVICLSCAKGGGTPSPELEGAMKTYQVAMDTSLGDYTHAAFDPVLTELSSVPEDNATDFAKAQALVKEIEKARASAPKPAPPVAADPKPRTPTPGTNPETLQRSDRARREALHKDMKEAIDSRMKKGRLRGPAPPTR